MVGTVEADTGDVDAVLHADEVLLETDLTIVDEGDAGLNAVVGDRQQPAGQPPGRRDLGGDLGEGGAVVQAGGPVQVGAEIAIAEAEPVRAP